MGSRRVRWLLALVSTRGGPFREIALALALILISAALPLVYRVGPNQQLGTRQDIKVTKLTDTQASAFMAANPARRARREAQLKTLQDQGFVVRETAVYAERPTVNQRAWWQGARAVQAQYSYWPDGGYISISEMDDGNPDTYEYFVYGVSPTGVEVWGAQQFHVSDPNYAWSWSENINAPSMGALQDDAVGVLCALLSPTVGAAGANCRGGWAAARGILTDAFGAAATGTGGALFWCVGASLGYGGCLAGNFFGTFTAGIIWYTGNWYRGCSPVRQE